MRYEAASIQRAVHVHTERSSHPVVKLHILDTKAQLPATPPANPFLLTFPPSSEEDIRNHGGGAHCCPLFHHLRNKDDRKHASGSSKVTLVASKTHGDCTHQDTVHTPPGFTAVRFLVLLRRRTATREGAMELTQDVQGA